MSLQSIHQNNGSMHVILTTLNYITYINLLQATSRLPNISPSISNAKSYSSSGKAVSQHSDTDSESCVALVQEGTD